MAGAVGLWRHTGGTTLTTTPTTVNYDTEDRNDSATYSKSGSAVVLPAGRFLCAYQYMWFASGTNARGNSVIEARKNATVVPGSKGTGYQRNTANDAAWAAGACIVQSDGDDELDIRAYRDTDASQAAADADRTWLFVARMDDDTAYAEYVVADGASYGASTYAQVGIASTTVETVPSTIGRTGDNITLAANKAYLIMGGVFFDGTSSRTSRFTSFTLAGSTVPGSTGYAYMRQSSDEFGGPSSFAIVETGGSSETLTFQARGPNGGTVVNGGAVSVGAESGIMVSELPSVAEWYAASDSTLGQNVAATSLSMNFNRTVDHASTDIFSSGATASATFAASLDLFCAAAWVARRTGASGTRLTREARFLVAGTEVAQATWGTYNRGDQSNQDGWDSAWIPRGLVSGTSGQALTLSSDRNLDAGWDDGSTCNTTDEPLGFYALDLNTLYTASPATERRVTVIS